MPGVPTGKAGLFATAVESRPQKEPPAPATRVFQDLLLDEGVWAVKRAVNHQTLPDFYDDLLANLPQNSTETRRRYTQSLLRWFFSDGTPQGFATRVWSAYGQDSLLVEVLRFLYLKYEPLMGECVASGLFPISNGSLVPHSYLHNFVRSHIGDESEKANKRLKANLRKLGFLARAKPTHDHLRPLNPSRTAVILILHKQFAENSVRTLEMPAILADPFWKYLGCKSEDEVRRVLRDADNAGQLAKYVVADQLELVTPRFTVSEFLDQKIRL